MDSFILLAEFRVVIVHLTTLLQMPTLRRSEGPSQDVSHEKGLGQTSSICQTLTRHSEQSIDLLSAVKSGLCHRSTLGPRLFLWTRGYRETIDSNFWKTFFFLQICWFVQQKADAMCQWVQQGIFSDVSSLPRKASSESFVSLHFLPVCKV